MRDDTQQQELFLTEADGAKPPSGGAYLNLLLVSQSMNWEKAAGHATLDIARSRVIACSLRDPLARRAAVSPGCSDPPVDGDDADGLLNELAVFADEIAAVVSDVLTLGGAKHFPPTRG